MESKDLRGIVRALIEARIRETDITDGRRVQFGSTDHVSDLEMRISELERWRDRQRRGSEARANYARLISQLKRELRSALRVNDPKPTRMDPMDMDAAAESAPVAPVTVPLESAIAETDEPKKPSKKKKVAEGFGDGQAWVVFHQYDGDTIGFPSGRVEAEQNAMARNRVARLGAWGKQNPGKDPPYIVVTAEEAELLRKSDEEKEIDYLTSPHGPATERSPRPQMEAVDMEDPEYSSIEDFVQFMLDDERDTYTHEDIAALNFRTRTPINNIRRELDGYGFKLGVRAPVKHVRGFSSNSHDRWFGKGSMPTHGGAGIDPQTGRATTGRGDI